MRKLDCGKTAIAQGIAKHIVDGKVPEVLKEASIYSLDIGVLIAGTKYIIFRQYKNTFTYRRTFQDSHILIIYVIIYES
jgi:hypothetical protein